MTTRSLERIRSDFDRIAALPARRDSALDLGCGTGRFTRRLAGACGEVLGLDLSERMIERARSDSAGVGNVRYACADLLTVDLPPVSLQAAWDAHGRGETYPSLAEVRDAAAGLPGAVVRRRLPWRYLMSWTRPLDFGAAPGGRA